MRTLLISAVLAIAVAAGAISSAAAAGADPVVGTWQLNVSKSTFTAGQAVKSQTRTYSQSGGTITLDMKTVGSDGKEFEHRAKCVADEYSEFEATPGVKINGNLTLGENTADNGGVRIALMALEGTLASGQGARQSSDGFTPEQKSAFLEDLKKNGSQTLLGIIGNMGGTPYGGTYRSTGIPGAMGSTLLGAGEALTGGIAGRIEEANGLWSCFCRIRCWRFIAKRSTAPPI